MIEARRAGKTGLSSPAEAERDARALTALAKLIKHIAAIEAKHQVGRHAAQDRTDESSKLIGLGAARSLWTSLSRCSSRSAVRRFLSEITDDDAVLLVGDWPTWARLNQLPTRDGEIADFQTWLVLGGAAPARRGAAPNG